jgi:hypothetical protein
MSPDEAALIRLWKEKRGEAELEDLSDNLEGVENCKSSSRN